MMWEVYMQSKLVCVCDELCVIILWGALAWALIFSLAGMLLHYSERIKFAGISSYKPALSLHACCAKPYQLSGEGGIA